jgi:hypothetical protein
MVTYQPDSPSRMCDGSLDEAARMLHRSFVSLKLDLWIVRLQRSRVRLNMPLTQPYPRVCTHRLHFGPRVSHCPEATHVCIVRAPVPPPHTHVPAPPHTLTHSTPPLSLA